MKRIHALALAIAAGGLLGVSTASAQSSGGGSAFTYQGEATDPAGVPLNGAGEVKFRLYSLAAAGTWVNNTERIFPVTFARGQFTVSGLEFGAGAYGNGDEQRWLEIAVKAPGQTTFTTLFPRQRLTQAPFAAIAGRSLSMDAVGLTGSLSPAFISSNNVMTSTSAQTVTGLKTFSNPSNSFSGTFSGNGSQLTNVTAAAYTGVITDSQLSSNVALLNRNNQTFTQNNIFNGSVGIGITPSSTRLHVAGSNQFALRLDSTSTAGTWATLSNTTTGGREYSLISTGSANGEGAGKLLFLDTSAGAARMTIAPNGAVGVGTAFPGAGTRPAEGFDLFEVAGPDAGIRVRNINDAIGGVMWNSFGTLHLGMYNPTAATVGQIATLDRRAFFSMSADGRVGSTTNTGGAPIYRNLLDDGTGNFIVRANGTLSGNHVALFENTGGNNADGIAIKINKTDTNRENNFVTFYNATGTVTGRIEGFDLQSGDWVSAPPVPSLNLRSNITLNSPNTWFSPGSLPSLVLTQTSELPSLTPRYINVGGIQVMNGVNWNPGRPPIYSQSGGALPSVTGSPITIGNPPILVDAPSRAQLDPLVRWGLESNSLEVLLSLQLAGPYGAVMEAAVQAEKDGGVTYGSKGADYAEYLERADASENIKWGQVVGVRGGKVSKVTAGAEQVMVISRAPIVLGNQPNNGDVSRMEKVAFMGQVPVVVRGEVNAGDYIVASGLNDGSAVAVSPDALELDHLKRLVGRAWESSHGKPVGFVNTAIGVNQQAAQHVLNRHASTLARVSDENASLKDKVSDLESRLAAIEELLRVK
ncbi:MAG: hypothetical protein ACOYN0_09070 [Phycisphaerales bacterium]